MQLIIVILSLSLLSVIDTFPADSKNVDQLLELLKSYQCRESDPNLNDCILKGAQFGISKFTTGFSEIGLPKLDPVEIESITHTLKNGQLNGEANLNNVKISGLSAIKLSSIDMKREANSATVTLEGTVPLINAKGNHQANVEFYNFTITSKGTFDLTISDLTFKIILDDEIYEEDGHTYVRTKHIELTPTIGDLKLKADGISKDEALNDMVIDFVNKLWPEFYKLVIEEARSTWEPYVLNIINNIHKRVPLDLVLLSE